MNETPYQLSAEVFRPDFFKLRAEMHVRGER